MGMINDINSSFMGLVVTHTARDGRISRLELVYLRGSHIKFIVLPEIVRDSPIFEKLKVLYVIINGG